MNSYNDLNEISSKSLLANVLDINDDFGVLSSNNSTQTSRLNHLKHKSKLYNKNEYSTTTTSNHYDDYGNHVMNRENSNLSALSELNSNTNTSNLSKSEIMSLKFNLNLILNELKMISKKVRDDEEDESRSLHWKFAAMVIDRLCMVFFAVATLTSTVLILFTSKNFFKFK